MKIKASLRLSRAPLQPYVNLNPLNTLFLLSLFRKALHVYWHEECLRGILSGLVSLIISASFA